MMARPLTLRESDRGVLDQLKELDCMDCQTSEVAIAEIERLRAALEDICSASHGDEARAIALNALKR